MMDPTKITQTLNHNVYVERDHLKMWFLKYIDLNYHFNKDMHMPKTKILNKINKIIWVLNFFSIIKNIKYFK
jgi:hypothetical protein